MVSNYITVVYKFFLRAHRKQFLHANASKNKQPQAFKHRADTQLSFHFAYCKATISKKEKNKNKNRSKSRPCSERHARLTGHQALARALGPRAEGLTSGGRTGPGRGVRSLSGGHRVLSAHGFCGLETRTQPRPDSEERHFPSTTPVGGGLGAGTQGQSFHPPPLWGGSKLSEHGPPPCIRPVLPPDGLLSTPR